MAQHDYVISNGTGSAVRSDLNNALSAIVSQNSGATAPATTYAFQFWADTTTNTLKLRNSANSAWIELRQLDGDFTTVSVDNGTAAAPSIYFNASGTDTGIYSSGTDAVDISTAGTRRFGISSSGELTAYGGNLTLNAQGDLRFADSDSSNWVAFQAPATVASNVTWTLPSADGTANQTLVTNGSGTLSWATPTSTSDKITEGNTEAEVVDTGSDGHFKVTTEGTERLRCDSSGRLLIGTSSSYANYGIPLLQLDNSSGAELSLRRSITTDATNLGYITAYSTHGLCSSIQPKTDGTQTSTSTPGAIAFLTQASGSTGSPTEAMRINNQRELLIGTTTRTANGGVLQVSNGITFPATQSACSDANTLDDYEEGTWTPELADAASGGNLFTHSVQNGLYTKIGNVVTVYFRVTWTSKGSATAGNYVHLRGFPFAAKSNSSNYNYTGAIVPRNGQIMATIEGAVSRGLFGKSSGGYGIVSDFSASDTSEGMNGCITYLAS